MLNLDTHIVVKLLTNDLKPAERNALIGQSIGVSAMVLWEIAKLRQFDRIRVGLEDRVVSEFLKECHVWPLDAAVALASTRLDF